MNDVVQHVSHQHEAAGSLFAAGGFFWYLLEAIRAGLPPWQMVPPILFGAAALLNAYANYRARTRPRG